MFKIFPIQDEQTKKIYAEACGAEPLDNAFAYGMANAESMEIMGFSQFEISEKGGYISDLRPKIDTFDYEAMFILGRATMNFIDLCISTHHCYISNKAGDKKLISAIGFKTEKDGLLFCDMNGMFDGNCSSHK